MSHDIYETPLVTRYASKAMLKLFSDQYKFSTWRNLWIALAEEERALGLDISADAIADMKAHVDDIDFEFAAAKEKELRHDVMAHIHTFAAAAPKAAGIIHLGATSAFVGDNTDLIQMRAGLILLQKKLYNCIRSLGEAAVRAKDIPTLAFTHFQPAQPTTVGKRMTLWLQDLVDDFYEMKDASDTMRFRGVKGTTGTQASFYELFNGDDEKVRTLDRRITERFGFPKAYAVTGQTYPRRLDSEIGKLLSLFAEDAHKIATDIRLLQSMKEVEEPFETSQVGSSAMAYKRNPMRSERICSLARFIMGLAQSLSFTASTQWFERTLDDSANKRLAIPQMFLAADAILSILNNVVNGLVINEKVIERNLARELPFMGTENILMAAVKKGGNRQDIHERIRELSHVAAREIKAEGKENRLIDYIIADTGIGLSRDEVMTAMDARRFTGRASAQVDEFNQAVITPLLEQNTGLGGSDEDLKV
ncbi:MAG: adenylosuccinate lyase [Spirochaetes bacterium]|nr:adenylosuccinate lyase [Spirochaetota bacterium]